MATTPVTIPAKSWGLAATGPCFVDVRNHVPGFVTTGSALPTDPANEIIGKHDISKGNPFSYSLTDSVYVWNDGDRDMEVAVTN